MASSMSSSCGGSKSRFQLARQWYAHTAGILFLWTRLALPLALVAAWARGPVWSWTVVAPLLTGPLAAGLYAALWIGLRAVLRLPLAYLKAADTVLLALAPAGAALLLGALWAPGNQALFWLPALGLFPAAWYINWMHGAQASGADEALPPAPPFVAPVCGPVTAGYRSYDRSHTGLDIGVPVGTPVVAPAAGRVMHAGPLEQWGYVVHLDHGGGWSTLFAHLDAPLVRCGAQVAVGQVVARSGTSGISTGPHVHMELRYHGAAVDPAPLIGALS